MSRWGRRIFLLSDESEMRSGKIMALMKGVLLFALFCLCRKEEDGILDLVKNEE